MFIRMTPFPLFLLDCGPVEMMTIHRLLRTREGPFCGRALIQPSPGARAAQGGRNVTGVGPGLAGESAMVSTRKAVGLVLRGTASTRVRVVVE